MPRQTASRAVSAVAPDNAQPPPADAVDRMSPDHEDRAHVYRFALSLCRDRWQAEDLAQEAILRAVRADPAFTQRSDLRKWLFRVTHNLWIDVTRKMTANTNRPLELAELVDATDRPDKIAEITEQMEATFVQMQHLPIKQRQVLHLRVVEEMSVDEVAETLNMTRGAVKTNLSLARKQMRELAERPKPIVSARNENE